MSVIVTVSGTWSLQTGPRLSSWSKAQEEVVPSVATQQMGVSPRALHNIHSIVAAKFLYCIVPVLQYGLLQHLAGEDEAGSGVQQVHRDPGQQPGPLHAAVRLLGPVADLFVCRDPAPHRPGPRTQHRHQGRLARRTLQ